MLETITSNQNKMVKLAASLLQKKYRDESGLFLVEGIRLIEEAAKSDWRIECCFVTQSALTKERVVNKNIKLIQLSEVMLNKLTETEQPQGIVAIVQKKTHVITDALPVDTVPLIIMLDSIQDPGNIGALIRTADASGCTGIILTQGCADPFSGKTVRASMGSLFHLPIISGIQSVEALSILKQNNVSVLATSLAARNLYYEANFKRPLAIVFGNEGSGVCEEVLQAADQLLYIPIMGKAESLNVAASAAVILFEATRQRRVAQ